MTNIYQKSYPFVWNNCSEVIVWNMPFSCKVEPFQYCFQMSYCRLDSTIFPLDITYMLVFLFGTHFKIVCNLFIGIIHWKSSITNITSPGISNTQPDISKYPARRFHIQKMSGLEFRNTRSGDLKHSVGFYKSIWPGVSKYPVCSFHDLICRPQRVI